MTSLALLIYDPEHPFLSGSTAGGLLNITAALCEAETNVAVICCACTCLVLIWRLCLEKP